VARARRRSELAADLDAWLLAREADGTLAMLREEWLHGVRSAAPPSRCARCSRRSTSGCSLMPLVGVLKRRDGVRARGARAREGRARARARRPEAEAQRSACALRPPKRAVRALFEASSRPRVRCSGAR
jgi:cyclohexadienyl dehydratase